MRIALVLLAIGLVNAQSLESKADAAAKQNDVMGSVLVAKGGKVLLKKGYGMANVELEVPNAPNTKFRLGSITKQFTATAIMQLASQGKLKPEDPVSKYVDAPPAWKDITIHHLLTHTSGIPNFTAFSDYQDKQREHITPAQLMARFKDKPLDFTPGSKYNYSNSAYEVLGVIIEKVSGESYEAYVKNHIFNPLDMNDSGYDHDTEILPHRAAGYEKGKDGKLHNAAWIDMSIPYSAGSLYSTVEDLYRWDRALYTEKILNAESKQKMFTPFLNNYGYGFIIRGSGPDLSISHSGGVNGFATMIQRFPNQDAVIIVLTNGVGVRQMTSALNEALFEKK
jgi:CubicO group peptidase (beta-lactamase class C family)